MYYPTTRVLTVLALLRAHGRMTGAELAQRLEVTTRTLRRYITMLQDLGVPIVAERGRSGAYELESNFSLPPMMFTNDEALALAIGLLAAQRLGLGETAPAVESARSKLEQVMPPDLKSRVQAVTETMTLDLPDDAVASPNAILLTMSSAAQHQRRVHMRYHSRQNSETERDLDPYGLAYRHGCWYVVGRCDLRQGLRSFRLDRVTQVTMTDEQFERPEQFDALAYLVQAIATLPRRYEFEILLKTDLLTARNEIFEVLGILEPAEEGILLHGTTDDLNWMARQLARLSFPFVIRQPDDLRAALHAHALQLAERASGYNPKRRSG